MFECKLSYVRCEMFTRIERLVLFSCKYDYRFLRKTNRHFITHVVDNNYTSAITNAFGNGLL